MTKIDYSQELFGLSEGLEKVIERCLYFNPYFRSSAAQLLKLPVFKEFHTADPPSTAPSKISIVADNLDVFDYESGTSSLTVDELIKILRDDIGKLKA